ncbi:MAG: hypothetical protein ACE5JI_23065 [Acidobacteriota bacterium]
MKVGDVKSGAVSFLSAFAASLCCVLPLVVILLGLGSGAFMATTMQYRSILIPTGVGGLALGYFLYFRERRRCRTMVCHMAGSKTNLALLIFSTSVVSVAVFFDLFPVFASKLIMSALPN